jgi:DNA-binding GntR family transcriptional regulator
LEKEGVVSITPYKGARVAEPDDREVQEMFEVMSGLEAMSARLAVEKMTHRDLEMIEQYHNELEISFQKREHDRYLEINWAYHEFIQALAQNEVLNRIIAGLRQKILLYRRKQLYQPNRFEASIKEHREILKAFQLKQPRKAEDAMRVHLINQGKSISG